MTTSTKTESPAATGVTYQSGFGNEFATEAVAGALPQGQNSPQKVAVRPLCRASQRDAVHRAARDESPLVAVSHPSVGGAPAVSADGKRPAAQHSV